MVPPAEARPTDLGRFCEVEDVASALVRSHVCNLRWPPTVWGQTTRYKIYLKPLRGSSWRPASIYLIIRLKLTQITTNPMDVLIFPASPSHFEIRSDGFGRYSSRSIPKDLDMIDIVSFRTCSVTPECPEGTVFDPIRKSRAMAPLRPPKKFHPSKLWRSICMRALEGSPSDTRMITIREK